MFDEANNFQLYWQKILKLSGFRRGEILGHLLCLILGFGGICYGLWQLKNLASGEIIPGPIIQENCQDNQSIKVDVSGAVRQPGLYELDYPARIADAISKAGGISQQASSNYVAKQLNLAKILKDEEKIYLPYREEDIQIQTSTVTQNSTLANNFSSGLVSINNASNQELEELPQIGEKRAADIVAGRPYGDLNELVSKEIVTESIFAEINKLISL